KAILNSSRDKIAFFYIRGIERHEKYLSFSAASKARDEDPDLAVSGRRILAESLPGASGG
ncbi:hypothetical protein, partial [Salisediminibacterium halotolerans]